MYHHIRHHHVHIIHRTYTAHIQPRPKPDRSISCIVVVIYILYQNIRHVPSISMVGRLQLVHHGDHTVLPSSNLLSLDHNLPYSNE